MRIEGPKSNTDEATLIDTLFNIWENRWAVISIFTIFIISGLVFNQFAPNSSLHIYTAEMNIIIEDSNYYSERNPFNTKTKIVEDINMILASAYNYEKWNSVNENLSQYVDQHYLTSLRISDPHHTINIQLRSMGKSFHNLSKKINAIESYLIYTAKVFSKKYVSTIKNEILDKSALKFQRQSKSIQKEIIATKNKIINSAKQEIELKIQSIQQEIEAGKNRVQIQIKDVEHEIRDTNIRIKIAEESLIFINHNIKKEVLKTSEVIFKLIELMNIAETNKLIIISLEKRKRNLNFIFNGNKIDDNASDDLVNLSNKLNKFNIHLDLLVKEQDAATLDSILKNLESYDLTNLSNNLDALKNELIELKQSQEEIKFKKVTTNKKIVKIGKDSLKQPNISTNSKLRLIAILLVSVSLAVLVSFFFILLRKEYINKHRK